MSDCIESSAYFYRIITLVVEVGTGTLREVFYSKCSKATVATLFSTSQILSEFNRLKSKKCLSAVQYQQVTVNPDPDTYDISLLFTLLTNKKICGIPQPATGWGQPPPDTDTTLGADLFRIKEIRNQFVGRISNVQLKEEEFQASWGSIESILVRIASQVSSTVEADVKQKIENVRTRVLEPLVDREKKLLEVFLENQKEDADKYQAQLTGVLESLNNLHLKIDGKQAKDSLTSLQEQVQDIAQNISNMAQQGAVPEFHQNLHTIEMMSQQLDDSKCQMEMLIQQIQSAGQQPVSASYERGGYKRYSENVVSLNKEPKVTNPYAMSDKEILNLSKQIGYEWEQLRIHLDFTELQAHTLKRAFNDDVQQRIHQMLKSWHDVVVYCGENPRILLAAAFVNAFNDNAMAYKLVTREQFKANAKAKPTTVKRIQEITFSRRGYYQAYGFYYHPGSGSAMPHGGPGSNNIYGGNDSVKGAMEIHSLPSSQSSDKDWAYFLRNGKKRDVKKLLQTGALPEQKTLDEICLLFGRKSKLTLRICKAICEHIKSKHESIVNVWAAYTQDDPNKITFVVCLQKEECTENKEIEKSIRLHKIIEYSFIKRTFGEYSHESTEIMNNNLTLEKDIDDDAYAKLKGCVARCSVELMNKHTYLSIVSASSKRSKGYGSRWNLKQENCIVLYVHTKHYIPVHEEPFKTHYDGIPVDVREGAFIPFGKTATEFMQHVQMGSQIRGEVENNSYTEGTLGCFVDHPKFGLCGLTSAHVVLRPWNLIRLKSVHNGSFIWPLQDMCKKVYQPANQTSDIGHTVHLINKEGSESCSGMEVALFKLTSRHPISSEFPNASSTVPTTTRNINYEHWRICSVESLNKKMKHVVKFGSKTEFQDGIIEFDIVSVKELNYFPHAAEYPSVKLHKQIEVKPKTPGVLFADEGDSGALVFLVGENSSEHTCVGIVEGGTSYGTVVVTPIVPILEELNVSNLKNFDFENTLTDIHGKMENVGSEVQTVKNDVQALTSEMQRMHCGIQTEMQQIKQMLRDLKSPNP